MRIIRMRIRQSLSLFRRFSKNSNKIKLEKVKRKLRVSYRDNKKNKKRNKKNRIHILITKWL